MILKYALKNISRSMGRNILIGIIVFVIATAACVALSVQQAAANARQKSMEGLSVSGHIYVDRQYIMENMTPGPDTDIREVLKEMSGLTIEEMQYYATASSVQSFNYSCSISPNGNEDLEAMSATKQTTPDSGTEPDATTPTEPVQTGPNGETPPDGQMPGGQPGQPTDPGQMLQNMVYQGDFTLTGYSDESAMEDFISGVCSITDGRMFEEGTSEFECIIEQQLATLNGLSVGDQITLCNPNDDTETYTFTICGIYKNTTVSSNVMMAATDPSNAILTSYPVVESILASSEAASDNPMSKSITGTYYFASVEDYDKFEEEVRTMGLTEKYTVTSTDIAAFEQSLVPLDNLKEFAKTFLLITLLIGAVVLVVISIFNIRDRKYEIGALAAMGMKKHRISSLMLTEILIVTLCAILIGCAVGSVISVPVTNSLLAAQTQQQIEEDAQTQSNFGRDTSNTTKPRGGDVEGEVDYVDSIGFSTNFEVLLQMIAIGVGLSLVSGSAAVFSILRYDPKQILANRD